MSTNYTKMKVKELSDLLKQRGLDTTGTKPDFIARLKKDDEAKKASQVAKKDEEDEVNVDDTDNVDIVDTEQTPATKSASTTDNASNTQTSAPATQTQTITQEAPKNAPQDTTTTTSNAQQETTIDNTQPVDENSRKKIRAERFKIPLQETESSKAIQRAARFGLPVKGTNAEQTVTQNKNPNQQNNVASAEKKAQRAERFGKQVFAVKPPTHVDRLQQRQQRFGNKVWTADEEDKKRKRAERFNSGADKKVKTT